MAGFYLRCLADPCDVLPPPRTLRLSSLGIHLAHPPIPRRHARCAPVPAHADAATLTAPSSDPSSECRPSRPPPARSALRPEARACPCSSCKRSRRRATSSTTAAARTPTSTLSPMAMRACAASRTSSSRAATARRATAGPTRSGHGGSSWTTIWCALIRVHAPQPRPSLRAARNALPTFATCCVLRYHRQAVLRLAHA